MACIENIRRYVASRTAQPLLGLGDSVHRIHTGHELEAEIEFSDLAAVVAAHQRMVDALQDAKDFIDPETDPPPFGNRELLRRIDAALKAGTS